MGRDTQAQRDFAENRCPRLRAAVPGRPAPFRFRQPQGRRLLFRPHRKRFVEVFIPLTGIRLTISILLTAQIDLMPVFISN